jgi:hypothetical protein
MPDGTKSADMQIKPEELKAQIPELQDLNLGLSRIQSYVHDAKAQESHFGQSESGSPAGKLVRQSLDTLAQSVGDAQAYVASIITAVQGTVGQTTQTENTNKQNFNNQQVQ